MTYWLILILLTVAMVAIVLVFMWWWTTDNWDWASAELKPPRPVPHEPLKAYLDWVDWRGEMEQRVTALEEKMPEDMNLHVDHLFGRVRVLERKLDAYLEPATPSTDSLPTEDSPMQRRRQAWGMGSPGGSALKGGKATVATPFDETHKPILSSESTPTPSPATASPTTDSPSDALEPEFTEVTHLTSLQSGPPTTTVGTAEPGFMYVDPPDAST